MTSSFGKSADTGRMTISIKCSRIIGAPPSCIFAPLRPACFCPSATPESPAALPAVKAWQEWAGLGSVSFYHPVMELTFTARRGDIVIYDALLSDKPHDHIGIVLGAQGQEITVAEGNAGNSNRSAIVRRHAAQHVAGYIRIDDFYEYCWTSEPGWEI